MLAHQTADAAMPNVQINLFQFFSHSWASVAAQAEAGLFFDVRQCHHIRSLPAAGWSIAECAQTARTNPDDFAQSVRWKTICVFFDESKSHCFRPAKNWVAFFRMSRLSYPEPGSCAIQGPLPSTTFMLGNGEGRIVSRLVMMDRGGV